MTYKLYKNSYGEISCVICIEKEISIPFDPDNTDYQAYLKWLAEGNTPEPAEGAE
jgi:hypothetical protein